MAVNGIEIKLGQVWRMSNGDRTTIEEFDSTDRIYPWRTSDEWVTACGYEHPSRSSDFDLIELITDAPTTNGRFIGDHGALTFDPLPEPGLTINPKDAIGSTKLPLHLWPAEATAMGCLGMLEGKLKYGRNNYIAGEGVVASIYVDAAKRHIDAWFAGEEVSPDTQNDHLGNALACLAIIVKTRAHGKLIDDRDFAPNAGYRKFVEELTPSVKRLQTLFADKSPRHFTVADNATEAGK